MANMTPADLIVAVKVELVRLYGEYIADLHVITYEEGWFTLRRPFRYQSGVIDTYPVGRCYSQARFEGYLAELQALEQNPKPPPSILG